MGSYGPYTEDSSGYVTGGGVTTLRNTLAYTDTVAKALFTIPAGAIVTGWILNVGTLFNSDGTDQVNLGVTGTAAKFASAVDVSATGLKSTGVVAAEIGNVQSVAAPVLGIYAPGGSAASTGAMIIMVQFYIP